jgi:hypothetical protein
MKRKTKMKTKNNIEKDINSLPLRSYDSNKILGRFAPVPYAGVELSEQYLKLIKKNKKLADFNKLNFQEQISYGYVQYRFGRIQLANAIFKNLVAKARKGHSESKFTILGLACTNTLQRDYAESNELLQYLEQTCVLNDIEKKCITYWKCRNDLGLNENNILIQSLDKVTKNNASWFLLELFAKDKSFTAKNAKRMSQKWGLESDGTYLADKWQFKLGTKKIAQDKYLFSHNMFALDYNCQIDYLEKYGITIFLNNFKSCHGCIPYTSELLASLSLFANYINGPVKYKSLYSEDKIQFIGNYSISHGNRNQLVHDSLVCDFGVRDFNTSNFGGRTYTLDLSKSKNESFRGLEVLIKKACKRNKNKIDQILDSRIRPNSKNLDVWFDASFTSGGSNIYPHLHTAGLTKSYFYTFVYYAQVPDDMKKDQGNLIFTNTDIANPNYKKSPLNTRIKVKTGDLYGFPSYFFHSTTPSFTRKVRLTFNFDFLSERETINNILL